MESSPPTESQSAWVELKWVEGGTHGNKLGLGEYNKPCVRVRLLPI